LGRHTDGLRLVPSSAAVANRDLHDRKHSATSRNVEV
jgi:hypothetical protein